MQQEELLKKVRLVTIVFAAVYILMGIAMIAFQLQFKSVCLPISKKAETRR